MESEVEFEVLHASRGVRIGAWRCNCTRPGLSDEEYAAGFEVVFPRSGAFVKHLGRRRVFADPNHVIFFNPGETYQVSHPVPGGDECTVFSLDAEAMGELLGSGGSARGGTPGDAALVDSRIYSSHRRILDLLLRDGRPDPLEIDDVIIELLARVLAGPRRSGGGAPMGCPRPGTMRDRRRAVETVKQLLAARFDERLTLDDVASETYYSKYHLARLFRGEVGLPIHRYLTRLRLRAALERAIDPATDLSRLALELGFSSHSHLTSAFRAEFGRAPSELRRGTSASDLRKLSKDLKA